MKALIIGLGSIGKRHVEALVKLNSGIQIFALRSKSDAATYEGVANIYKREDLPPDLSFVIISNPTSEHYQTIRKCIPLGIPLFIEKPALMHLEGAKELMESIALHKIPTYTAFNMRFHPVIQWLKEHLPIEAVLEVNAYCGSYLPDWRAGIDYRSSYSAQKDLGGGVHLDLTHELDYIKWLFGQPDHAYAFTAKISDLAIDSADYAHYHLQYPRIQATVTLNYYRRQPKRSLEIVMQDQTWQIDLIGNTVRSEDGQELFNQQEDRQLMYERQMKYFLENFKSGQPMMNSLQESVQTLSMALPQPSHHA